MIAALVMLSAVGAMPQGQPGDSLVVLHGGHYVDVRAGALRPNGTIVVRGGKIVDMRAPAAGWRPPPGARVIELDGRTILPGLIDAHVHLTLAGDPGSNARATLAAGFTTVLDLGSSDGAALRLRDAIAAGEMEGPRVIAAGSWIGSTGGVCEFGGATVRDAAEARARARGDLARGADVLKVCVTGWPKDAVSFPDSIELKAEPLAAVMDVARTARRPVYAHAIGRAGALLAAAQGVRALAHTPVVDSAAAATLAGTGIRVISTLASLGPRPGGAEVRRSFGLLLEVGVPVVLGTDAGVLAHGKNAEELVALDEAGLTPAEALRAATVDAAALLGVDEIGEIAIGKAADFVVVEGDPLTDLRVVQRPVMVLKGGRPIR